MCIRDRDATPDPSDAPATWATVLPQHLGRMDRPADRAVAWYCARRCRRNPVGTVASVWRDDVVGPSEDQVPYRDRRAHPTIDVYKRQVRRGDHLGLPGDGTVVTGHPPGRGLVPGRPGRSRPCLHRSGGPDPVTATPVGPRRHRSTVGRCDQTSGTARCDRRGRTRLDQPRITGWGCWACNRSRADCMAPVISS